MDTESFGGLSESREGRSRRVLAVGLGAGLTAGFVAFGAQAQTAGAAAPAAAASAGDAATSLQNVTVTARKRDEKALDVPISIQAFGERALRAADIYDLQDLKSQSGFTLNEGAGTSAGGRTLGNLTLRGLQGDSGFLPNEVSGGLFVDGIFVSAGVNSINTRDVARVEVLKGPQNAFFGRNTFGGAINFITKTPSSTFRGEVNSAFTGRGSTDIDASIEGPLIPDVANGRLTVVSHRRAAQYTATDGGDLGAEKTTSISGTIYATPVESLWIRARGHYQQDDDSMPALAYLRARGNTSCAGQFFPGQTIDGQSTSFTPATGYFCGSIPKLKDSPPTGIDANTVLPAGVRDAYVDNSLNDPFRSDTPRLEHTGMRRNVTRGSIQAGSELPYNAEWAFNLGYNRSASTSIWDLDHTNTPNYLNELALVTSDVTVDTRVTSDPHLPYRGLIGVSYYLQRYQFEQLDYDNAVAPARDANNYINNHSRVPAAYAAVEYDILKQLTVSADVRRQNDHITTFAFNNALQYENTAKNWLPRVALRYKPSDDTTAYINYSKGVQQLATNSGYINGSPAVRAYIASQVPGSTEYTPQPKLDSYELGIKQSLWGDRIQYALAVYDEKWKNRLTNTVLLCPPGQANTAACPLGTSGTSVAIGNDATIRGLELSIDAAVARGWDVGAYVDYKHARFDRDYNASLGAITGTAAPRAVRFDGNTLPRVPAWQIAANVTYRQGLLDGWAGFVRADVTYTGSMWESDLNIVKTNPYTRVNLRIGADKGQTGLEFFVKNLFNDTNWDYVARVADLGGPYPGYFTQGLLAGPPPRREVGLRARYAF